MESRNEEREEVTVDYSRQTSLSSNSLQNLSHPLPAHDQNKSFAARERYSLRQKCMNAVTILAV